VKLNHNISFYGEKLVESVLFHTQKRKINELNLLFDCKISSNVASSIEFAIKNETLSKLKIVNERYSYQWGNGELDSIFLALSENSSIQSFCLGSSIKICKLNFQNPLGCWNFLYLNESLKELTFRRVQFEENIMYLLEEALKGNRSIETLNLISTNFEGDFSFLESNKTIKSLNINCWAAYSF
jgi:hypothetical protein